MKSNKTLWQKVYSFFGFWTFVQHHGCHKAYLTIYWCMFPWFKFYRKFDILSIDVSKRESLESQRKRLVEKDPSVLKYHPSWAKPFP